MGQATSGSCAVVHGTTIRGTAVRPFATGINRRTATTTSVFGLLVLPRALPWSELVDGNLPRVQGESSLVPVMEATLSKNLTELGSLVGKQSERLLNSPF